MNHWSLSLKYRTQTRNGDAGKLDNIQTGLSKLDIPLHCIREKEITDMGFLKGGHVPDLIINRQVILEHDTVKVHGELGFENAKTLRRNADYAASGRPFFIINQDLAKQCGLDEVNLSQYLYYHSLMMANANKEASLRSQ